MCVLAVVLGVACSTESPQDLSDMWPELPNYDVTVRLDSNSLADQAGTDLLEDIPLDKMEPDTSNNTPPSIDKLDPLELPMGTSTTLDLAPYLHDSQDAKDILTLTWNAQHVALELLQGHELYIVAPVNWFGAEPVIITVTDSGSLTGTQQLMVNVIEVIPPEPTDPPLPTNCDTLFSYAASPTVNEVLLSGSFNNWGASADTADVLTDADGDDTFDVTLKLDPGSYQYKFIVDGNWLPDPANDNTTDDGYGGVNSVIEVLEGCGE